MISPRQQLLRNIGRAVLPMVSVIVTLSCTYFNLFYDLEVYEAELTEEASASTIAASIPHTQTALAEQVQQANATMTARTDAPPTAAPPPAAPSTAFPPPASAPPVITRVDFLKGIPATGAKFTGWVSFTDPDGDVNLMELDVVRSVSMKGFENDPNHSLQGSPTDGRYAMQFWCYRKQEVTMRVTLFDAAGNSSNSMEFSFECY